MKTKIDIKTSDDLVKNKVDASRNRKTILGGEAHTDAREYEIYRFTLKDDDSGLTAGYTMRRTNPDGSKSTVWMNLMQMKALWKKDEATGKVGVEAIKFRGSCALFAEEGELEQPVIVLA